MIKSILRYLKGYVLVELRGNALEHLLNRINRKGIAIWDIKRIKHGFRFKMHAIDYRKLRPLIRYRKCTARILAKKGLPFIKYRSARRKALLAGIILLFIFVKLFSSFLWQVEFSGNETIPTEELVKLLTENGIKRGMLRSEIDISSLEQFFLTNHDKISWIAIQLQGTKLVIKVVEKKLIDETDLTDIIAAHSGVITEMIVLKGKPLVKEGDTVKAGQLLISAANRFESFAEPDFEGNLPPYLPPEDEQSEPARGIVKARVWYEGYGESEIIVTEERLTGQKESATKIKIGSKIFHFSGTRNVNFKYYRTEKEVKSVPIWRNIRLPIEIIKEDYLETVIYRERRSLETAVFLAKEKALFSILNFIPDNATVNQVKYSLIDKGNNENNIVRVKVVLEAEEDIAKPLPR